MRSARAASGDPRRISPPEYRIQSSRLRAGLLTHRAATAIRSPSQDSTVRSSAGGPWQRAGGQSAACNTATSVRPNRLGHQHHRISTLMRRPGFPCVRCARNRRAPTSRAHANRSAALRITQLVARTLVLTSTREHQAHSGSAVVCLRPLFGFERPRVRNSVCGGPRTVARARA
jgi:hypothetical protein